MGFWTGAASGLLSGLGSLGQGLFNTFFGQKQSKELMDYQYQLQQKAIDAQNFYNSPAEQMKRLASAGLSPNLVYGSGVDGNQSSAASPSIANKHGQMGNPLQDATQSYYQARLADAQVGNLESTQMVNEERAKLINAQVLGQLSDNKWKDSTLEHRIKLAEQKLAESVANEALTWSKTRNEDNRLDEIYAQIDYLKARNGLTDEQAATEVVRRNALRAGITLNLAQARQVAHMIDFIDAGTELREQEYEQKEIEFESSDELNKWLQEHPNAELGLDIAEQILNMWNGKSSSRGRSRKRKRKR